MELNIEEIKEVNKKVYENMVEIYGRKISDEMWGTKRCDALWELGYSVYKGEMSIKDAKERLQRYISYMHVQKMLCTLKGKKFYAGREMLDIWSFDSVTKKLKNSENVSIL